MYITVRTIRSNGGELSTAVKYYYDYQVAKTNLIMQKDTLIMELLIKYTKGNVTQEDFAKGIYKYGDYGTHYTDVLALKDYGKTWWIKEDLKSE